MYLSTNFTPTSSVTFLLMSDKPGLWYLFTYDNRLYMVSRPFQFVMKNKEKKTWRLVQELLNPSEN